MEAGMRIYTPAGDLAFKTFTFPDGQPHFKLETYEIDFRSVTIEVALRDPSNLFLTILASETLRQHGYSEVNLDIRYLLGARMDRAIDSQQPFTLQTVSRLINSCGFTRVRILDVHSEVATRLIRNSENILPYEVIRQVSATVGPSIWAVCPDAGAKNRCQNLALGRFSGMLLYCEKKRDMASATVELPSQGWRRF
jgi:ribose-phosphate pyrophosphokinase